MNDWKNEDDIKAELRAMTDELRRLREGLRNMVSPPQKPNPTRAFLHRQSRPLEAAEPFEPVEPGAVVQPEAVFQPRAVAQPRAEAADRKRRRSKKKPR